MTVFKVSQSSSDVLFHTVFPSNTAIFYQKQALPLDIQTLAYAFLCVHEKQISFLPLFGSYDPSGLFDSLQTKPIWLADKPEFMG